MNHFVYPQMEMWYWWQTATVKIEKNERRFLPRILGLAYAYIALSYIGRKSEYEEHKSVAESYIRYTRACLLYYILFVRGSKRRKWKKERKWRREKLTAELNTATCSECGKMKMKSRTYSTVEDGRVVFVCQQCPEENRGSWRRERKRESREDRYYSQAESDSSTDSTGHGASQNGTESVQEARRILNLRGKELTAQTVREAYKEAVKRTHPDMGGNTEEFIQVQKAKETLLDHLKKSA